MGSSSDLSERGIHNYVDERDVQYEKKSWQLVARGFFDRLGGKGSSNANQAQKLKSDLSNAKLSPGAGATSGLPTCADDGTVNFVYRQINQDVCPPNPTVF
jgi:hypothetical protein